MDRLPLILEAVGDGIANGVFFRRTEGTVWGEHNCNHCDFPAVCGRDRRACAERKAGAPEVLRWVAASTACAGGEEGK